MRAVLKLEIIGEPYHWLRRNRKRATVKRVLPLRKEIDIIRYGRKQLRPWVAKINGLHQQFGFDRQFLTGMRDWSLARADGMRGVYEYYALPPGIYEVNECIELGCARRYFIRVIDEQMIEITREEAIAHFQPRDPANPGWD